MPSALDNSLQSFTPIAIVAKSPPNEAIAEPVARPEHVHEYRLTPYSLYAAVSVDIAPASICDVLDKLSKVKLPARIRAYVMDCTKNFGRAKLVLRGNRHHVESSDAAALRAAVEASASAERRATALSMSPLQASKTVRIVWSSTMGKRPRSLA